jgi:eukaryotic translation initiation factor 2C
MIQERIQHFYNNWNKLPSHILFYRDGVSESQYGMVHLEELPQIKEGCRRVIASEKLPPTTSLPKITLLVVGKRHHTRFFPYKKSRGYSIGDKTTDKSLPAGLIIDHTVVNAHQFSFYLQSHDSPLGTAKSGHYVVIVNESEYTSKKLQEIVSKRYSWIEIAAN